MDMTIDRTKRGAKSNNLLITKGVIAIVWGAIAVFAAFMIPMGMVVAFGILNFIAAGLTLAYAYSNRHLQISHQWLLLEGMVELAAGVVFTFFVFTLEQFISYMSYGIIFIVTLQFIYGYTLILTGRFSAQNMLMRFISVLAGTIISVGLLAHAFTPGVSLIVVGIFSVLYGALNMQFATKLNNVIMGPAN
jgi:hypothetical protein